MPYWYSAFLLEAEAPPREPPERRHLLRIWRAGFSIDLLDEIDAVEPPASVARRPAAQLVVARHVVAQRGPSAAAASAAR